MHNDKTTAHLFAGKLTYQAGPNTSLVFTVLGDPSTQKCIGTTFEGFPSPSTLENIDPFLGDLKTGGISGSLRGRHTVNERLFLEASLSRMDRKQNDVPDTDRGRSEPFFADFTTGIWSGGYGRVKEDHSIRTAGQLSASLLLAQHHLKAGIQFEDNSIDSGFDDEIGQFAIGNPGKGPLSFLPKHKRRYTALEFTLERSVRNRSHFSASYVLSRNHGNYSGLFSGENGQGSAHVSSLYSRDQIPNQTGLLPNDRTHIFKLFGFYRFKPGVTAGASLVWQSGTPLSEYIPSASLGPDHLVFLSPRGSVARTPSIWDLDLRATYDLASPAGTALKPRLILDVFHLFGRRKSVNLDQVHYSGRDENGNPTGENANYREPTHHQPPMTARLGVEVSF